MLARRLAGEAGARYEGAALATNLKVSGVPVFSAGELSARAGRTRSMTSRIARSAFARRLTLRGDRLVGAVLVGEADDALWYRDLIRHGASVAALPRRI